MISYAAAFGLALIVSAILTPLIRNLSFKMGIYDPPNERKIHDRVIPRIGGVAILLAFLTPVLGIAITEANVGQAFYRNLEYVFGIALGGTLIALVGLLDDLKGLGAKRKLLLQILVATGAFALGFKIQVLSLPFGGKMPMGVFSYFITVGWIVGVINAVNLIDGLDGLAGGIAFFVLVFNFVMGVTYDSFMVCFLAAALAGAILGFLFYNFNPASIFMGDSGSMFIGYILALGAINSGQKSSTTVALLTPIVAMGIPIMDTLFSMVRRFLEKRPMFSPDRGHIHHRLLEMGLTQRKAVVTLYAFTVVLVGVALLLHVGRSWQVAVGLLLMVVTFAVFARVVGVVEYFNKRRLRRLGVRTQRAETLRTLLFEALKMADQAQDRTAVESFLQWLGESGGFCSVALRSANSREIKVLWSEHERTEEGREETTEAAIPIQPSDKSIEGHVLFAWYSERGRVSAETEILLQVIVDRFAPALGQSLPDASPSP